MEVECDGGEECNESEWVESDAEPTYAEVSCAVRKVAKGKAAGEVEGEENSGWIFVF